MYKNKVENIYYLEHRKNWYCGIYNRIKFSVFFNIKIKLYFLLACRRMELNVLLFVLIYKYWSEKLKTSKLFSDQNS